MTAIPLTRFTGMYPRFGKQQLGPTSAERAKNCRFLSGQLQALKRPALLYDFSAWEAVERVFRVTTLTSEFYAVFDDASVDFVRAPITQDGYNRHYWTTFDEPPRYATEDMLLDAFDDEEVPTGYLLGVPAPSTAPTLTPPASGDLDETRAYVYTFVSAYGEESAPSPPAVGSGDSTATWDLADIETTVPDPSERNITLVRIYRSITGTLGSVAYYFVTEFAIGTSTYSDSALTDEVALNVALESDNWNEPPSGLEGLLVHPNGFLVAFKGRDLYFSVPYRPHAWPVNYITTVKWNIIGLGIIGQSVVVLTESCAFVASGVRPEAMSLVQTDAPNPCTARRGIVSSTIGVIYPGPDGLMLIGQNGSADNLTKKFLTRREWQTQYRPWELEAVQFGSQYVAFYDDSVGFAIDFDEVDQAFIELDHAEWAHEAIQNDSVTGDVWLVRTDKTLRVWNPERGSPVTYLWRSKEFDLPDPINFGAVKVTYSDVSATGIHDQELIDAYTAFNEERIQSPLNPLNFAVLNAVRQVDVESTLPQISQQIHKGPLYQLYEVAGASTLTFRAYVNREEEPVYETEITDMELYRPPTGFKAILWQFELEGNAEIQSVKIAETAVELSTI